MQIGDIDEIPLLNFHVLYPHSSSQNLIGIRKMGAFFRHFPCFFLSTKMRNVFAVNQMRIGAEVSPPRVFKPFRCAYSRTRSRSERRSNVTSGQVFALSFSAPSHRKEISRLRRLTRPARATPAYMRAVNSSILMT